MISNFLPSPLFPKQQFHIFIPAPKSGTNQIRIASSSGHSLYLPRTHNYAHSCAFPDVTTEEMSLCPSTCILDPRHFSFTGALLLQLSPLTAASWISTFSGSFFLYIPSPQLFFYLLRASGLRSPLPFAAKILKRVIYTSYCHFFILIVSSIHSSWVSIPIMPLLQFS